MPAAPSLADRASNRFGRVEIAQLAGDQFLARECPNAKSGFGCSHKEKEVETHSVLRLRGTHGAHIALPVREKLFKIFEFAATQRACICELIGKQKKIAAHAPAHNLLQGMKIGFAQIKPTVGDLRGNCELDIRAY